MTGPLPEVLPLFETLVEIVARLRGPDGCPWDKEQTQSSLTQYAIEEAHELAEAIESGRQQDVLEELGDFLFQVILQAQVAQDEGHFNLAQVVAQLNEKMIRRHPHVFSGMNLGSTEEVWKNWEKIKAGEKKTALEPAPGSSPGTPAIFNYPKNLPALLAAAKIGRKTENWKFDWDTPEQVLEKVEEELRETAEALAEFRQTFKERPVPETPGREHLEHEIGDLLFATSQLARHVGLDPEATLRTANRRFERRFQNVVARAGVSKEEFAALPNERKEALWQQVKKDEK
ncbi:MAG: nucleoside triphosphate pyrophosphohydrolase [Bdellovibrionaceae bacterium]|nr:nucleoside triphosphate pyrophosphohydrolase [Pseudobdellovibrionaceae bacterium]